MLQKMANFLFLVVTLSWLWLYSLSDGKAPKLDSFLVDSNAISISGISSGGYFAVQFHVAFSKTIMGAGILAGGPFWCAQDNLSIALTSCMKFPDLISVSELVTITHNTAATDTIDPPSYLKNDCVYLLSGTQDTVVNPGVVKKLEEYYSEFVTVGNIYTEFSIQAEHAMITDDYGNKCNLLSPPYINNCNYSAAYYLLQHTYGDIKPANSSAVKEENLLEFDQTEFFLDLPEVVSMDTTGFVYVPSACQDQHTVCRLHIALHGCKQGRKYISKEFVQHAGYNGIAETNDLIILYPQAQNSVLNPNGCWDWWGYTSTAYASKLGPQMAGVKLMLDRAVGSFRQYNLP